MKMELSIGGQVVTWDSDQHPYWPPVDGDGQIISDVPWKFFDPPQAATAAAASPRKERP